MAAFRLFLVICIIAVASYTAVTVSNHGINLFPAFFGNIEGMGWSGQFNADFMSYLALSGLWVAWRHQFRPAGIALGLVAFVGGILFLAPYLLIQSYRFGGRFAPLLLGPERA